MSKTIGLGSTEAELLDLSGYVVEPISGRDDVSGGKVIKTTGSGSATGAFTGPDGAYWIDVGWFNESDGASKFSLAVNGSVVESWTGTGGTDDPETRRIAVSLETGDTITLNGARGGYEYARIDTLAVIERDGGGVPPDPDPDPAGATIGLGSTEAESLDLSGYVVEPISGRDDVSGGKVIKTTGSGSATGAFTGPDGAYWIDVGWFNESDGASKFSLAVNGSVVESWTGTGGTDDPETRRIAVSLETGDTITLNGARGGYEYARIDTLAVIERDGGGVPPDPDPDPAGATIGLGSTEAESLDLSGYVVEPISGRDDVSGGKVIKTTGSGSATGAFTGPDGAYWIDVGWFNESDGASKFSLAVNGSVVESWTGTGGTDDPETRRIAVSLETGDTITLNGARGGYEYARIDTLAVIERDGGGVPPDPDPDPAGATIGLGSTEAESLDLSGYVVEPISGRDDVSGGKVIKTTGSGSATGAFTGPDGAYWIDVGWFNESDGASKFSLAVNGSVVESWTGTGGTDDPETRRIAVSLETGDTITLNGARGGYEYARIDTLAVIERHVPEPLPGIDPLDFDFFAFTGQSNAEGHFFRRSGDGSPGPLGYQEFEGEMARLLGVDTRAIEAARGGSGSNEKSDPQKYWWDLGDDRPGPSLNEAIATINAAVGAGKDLDGIIWAQGEDDAAARYALATSDSQRAGIIADFKEATSKTFEYFWSQYGEVPIFIQELGEFQINGSNAPLDAMRAAQLDLIAAYDDVYFGASTQGMPHADPIHFSVEGYAQIAGALAGEIVETLAGDEFLFT